jgi:hypothetical protein
VDQVARAYAPNTLRAARTWLVEDYASIPHEELSTWASSDDPQTRRHLALSRGRWIYDEAWRTILTWEAARMVAPRMWGTDQAHGAKDSTWVYDLAYLMHKIHGGLTTGRRGPGEPIIALEHFEQWAENYDPHRPKPLPNLRSYNT